MPRIFDNIQLRLTDFLAQTLPLSTRADFCVGYFNLRGWKHVDRLVDGWAGGADSCCRVLVGMQRAPDEELRDALVLRADEDAIDQQKVIRLRRQMAFAFREQLTLGAPTNADEAALRRLARQLRSGKVIVKLFLRYPLHAKLYLMHRPADPNNPITGAVGSSNLTLAGLAKQGELNVDVLDHDACQKLQKWFDDRWTDKWCLDISEELAQIIEQSWAREEPVPPYHVYLKIAYHLSEEARLGLLEYSIPPVFGKELFHFQEKAVKIAAYYLDKRGGVLIGDVVGLGKTMMATALARMMEDTLDQSTLIICPKNLVGMWSHYRDRYGLRARIVPMSQVEKELKEIRVLQRFRLVLIDESHNLRNTEGKRYKVIREYVRESGAKCVLLSATPYNKSYGDLAAQLRLFVDPEEDLGIRPELAIQRMGGDVEFAARHQCGLSTLAAFEKSEDPDDWRELMRRYLIRRTRGFIEDNYAEYDAAVDRRYLTFADGTRAYFPKRQPHTERFLIDDTNPGDPYARLFAPHVVDAINSFSLPRYGLGLYKEKPEKSRPSGEETRALENLSKAGKRLMGFSRTNLFKRLESGGPAFLQSLERHLLRNHVYLHAIETDQPLPIGTQDAELLDPSGADEADVDTVLALEPDADPTEKADLWSEERFRERAAEIYHQYRTHYEKRFNWVRSTLFQKTLGRDLAADSATLLGLLAYCGHWAAESDAKLASLEALLTKKYPTEKVLVFTQFADTARYLEDTLQQRGIEKLAAVTGSAGDPTVLAGRFSPMSNGKHEEVIPVDELRVLIATDVLSEGQNLQDAHVIVNYDLPWAIIRLIQRAGRVDRIGQQHHTIHVNSFMPADGVERIIRLRSRVSRRLQENAEVVGTDETFFEGEETNQAFRDLYNEHAHVLNREGDRDNDTDLASQAFEIWSQAVQGNRALEEAVLALEPVSHATRPHTQTAADPEGVMVFLRTSDDTDALAWIDRGGEIVTQSPLRILHAAQCEPDTPALPHHATHHDLVANGAKRMLAEAVSPTGGLGKRSGARYRVYTRLKAYAEAYAGGKQGDLFASEELARGLDEILRFPLRESATTVLNRFLRSGPSDGSLAELVIELRGRGELCVIEEGEPRREARILCSLGLAATGA
jgi:superfamily II DNA or RNA helicase